MKTFFKSLLVASFAAVISLSAIPTSQAQTKLKAYYISESEILDAAAGAVFVPVAREVMKAGGGRAFRTGGGRIIGLEGVAPQRAVIFEWDSLEQAETFFKSKAWTDILPLRNKAQKTIRTYLVEAIN